MKSKTSGHRSKARAHTVHKRSARHRPVHKRVLLHPISWFLLLCVGVLIVGSTLRGRAVTYDVTAKISAPALTEPAVIDNPNDQHHFSASSAVVIGTCPDDSYVKLYRGGAFSGTDICNNGGRFNIQTSLSPGANELKVRVFNLTDDEGPASSPITVYYDLPSAASPPASAPVNLTVSNVEEERRQSGVVPDVTSHPTVSGLAPPFSDVTVTFYSEPSVCKTKADDRGVWACTLANPLPPGIHSVVVAAVTSEGVKLLLPAFQVRVVEYATPFALVSDYKYKAHAVGQTVEWKLAITGGTAPYELVIDWGDGSSSKVTRGDQAEFAIMHTYEKSSETGSYTVIVTAVDARGATTILQLAAAMQGDGVSPASGFITGITDPIRRWLWVVWPAYVAVVLMAISFWIGEREAYQRFVARRRAERLRPHTRGR